LQVPSGSGGELRFAGRTLSAKHLGRRRHHTPHRIFLSGLEKANALNWWRRVFLTSNLIQTGEKTKRNITAIKFPQEGKKELYLLKNCVEKSRLFACLSSFNLI